MKKMNILAALAVLGLAVCAEGQSRIINHPAAKTNNVMSLNFTLTAWPNAAATPHLPASLNADETVVDSAATPETQVSGTPFRITSSDIIASLNGVTNHNGGTLHFGASAQLMFRQILSPLPLSVNSLGTNRTIFVRQINAAKTTNTDISEFFTNRTSYVSAFTTGGVVQKHALASLTFASPKGLNLQLPALMTETSPSVTTGAGALRTLSWAGQGPGATGGGAPNLVVGGTVSGSAIHLE